ncbi:MAG: Hsp20/alpha crystallin family protein [Candidatus Marinimicrobia bacterium]|nr:Hsp20/alpha crystallin family protein [Candidatus Neomarinimicrobiota bacterium]
MTLVKWHPTTALRPWNNFDRIFRDFFNENYEEESSSNGWVPSTDIHEDDKKFTVTADLPGVDKKNVNINVKDNVLTLTGERVLDKDDKGTNYHRRERLSGSFKRCFRLSDTVIEDKISAKFKNGILSIDLPKAEVAQPREIEIKVA